MNRVLENPWLHRFKSARDRLHNDAGKVVYVSSLAGDITKARSEVMAAHLMKEYLKSCFIVTETVYSVASEIIDHFESLASTRYQDVRYFSETIHMDWNSFSERLGIDEDRRVGPLCITGLSGAGKSALVRYLYRLFDDGPNQVDIPSGTFRVLSWDMLSAKERSTASTILRTSRMSAGITSRQQYGKLAYLNGMIGFGVDELQFLTKSMTANSRIASLLMGLGDCVVPWFYVCNYSLLWRLLRRYDEDHSRIFPKIVHLKVGSGSTTDEIMESLCQYVEAISSCHPNLFSGESGFSEKVVLLSGGVPRNVLNLLSIANGVRHSDSASQIQTRHVERAYNSSGYAQFRTKVELLKHTHDYLIRKKRHDLVFPPELEAINCASTSLSTHEIDYQMLMSNLTATERSELKKRTKRSSSKSANSTNVITIKDLSRKARLKMAFEEPFE